MTGKKTLSAEDYVTDRALDALFGVIGRQEASLRANPAKATGSMLKGVLGLSKIAVPMQKKNACPVARRFAQARN